MNELTQLRDADLAGPRRLGLGLVLVAAAGLLGSASVLTGCETIKGVGEDVTNAGEALDDAVTGDDG